MNTKLHLPLIFVLFWALASCAEIEDTPPENVVYEAYYSGLEGMTADELKAGLYDRIRDHISYPYTSTATDVWDILKDTDRDPENPDNVILFYTGWSVNADQEYNTGQGWTREHVWAKSRGDFGTDAGAGTDIHHMRPSDVSVNSARNNRWFAESDEEYLDNGVPTGCYKGSSTWTWEPRADVKGDAARSIFYMAVRYEGENGEPDLEIVDYLPVDNDTKEPIHALLSDLLKWNEEDPVSDAERARNELIYTKYQQNRNPFIDHPEFAQKIWGKVK